MLKHLRPFLLLLLLGPAAQAATLPPDLGARLHRGYIQPNLERLEHAGRDLANALAHYCARPGNGRRIKVEQHFGDLAGAWARVELLRFGPLLAGNRLERFFFFPDPRGIVQRQVSGLLATADAALLAKGALADQSVAVQGLPALELALYGSGAAEAIASNSDAGRYRCAYARAVTDNLVEVSVELKQAWRADGSFATQFIQPGPGQPIYRSTAEVATEVLKAMATALQAQRDIKLLPALGASPERARGQRAPLWRSGQTQALLLTSTEAMRAFYQASGFADGLDASEGWLHTTFDGDLQRLASLWREPMPPFVEAVTDPDRREQLGYGVLLLNNLHAVAQEQLTTAFGVGLGFNSLDGD